MSFWDEVNSGQDSLLLEAGIDVAYTFVRTSNSIAIKAIPARTNGGQSSFEAFTSNYVEMDFLIKREDLVDAGADTFPYRGDTIHVIRGEFEATYEVVGEIGAPHSQHMDSLAYFHRISTKRISVISGSVRPSATIQLEGGGLGPLNTSDLSFNLELVFSEPVDAADVEASDFIQVPSGAFTITPLTPTGDVLFPFRFDVVDPTQDVSVTLQYPAGATTSQATGVGNRASNVFVVNYVRREVTVVITTDLTPDPTGVFVHTATFSEEVSGFNVGGISFTEGTATVTTPPSTSDGIEWSYGTTVTVSGTATHVINDSAAVSVVTNRGNTVSDPESVLYNPAVSCVVAVVDGDVNTSERNYTATFSEPVTGFEAVDIDVTNGAVTSGPTTSDSTVFNFAVSVSDVDNDTTLGIFVVDNAAASVRSGVLSDQSNTLNVGYVARTITSTISGPTTTTLTTINVDLDFSEDVAGVAIGGFSPSVGATVTNITGGPRNYNFDFNMPAVDGAYTVSFNAGAASATLDGRENAESNTYSVTLTQPTQPIPTLDAPSTTASQSFDVDVSFNEPVTGLLANDFNITNGTATNLTGSGDSYTLTVQATTINVDTEVTLPEDVCASIASGLLNVASNTVTTQWQNKPEPTIVAPASTLTALFGCSITFTHDVSGLELTDFDVTNGTASNLQTVTASSYTFDVTADAKETNVAITLPADSVTSDLNGLGNVASNTTNTLWQTQPVPTLGVSGSTSTSQQFTVTVDFDQGVTGLEASDFNISNGVAISLTPNTAASYDLVVESSAAETQTDVTLPANRCQAVSSGLNNVASNTVSVTWITNPEPTITIPSTTQTQTVQASVDFDKSVTGLEASDFAVVNGIASNLQGSGASYTVDITANAEDTNVSVRLPAASCTGTNGLPNAESNTAQTVWVTAPVPTLDAPASISDRVFDVDVSFNKAVLGLEASDFTITNGVVGTLSGSGASYTLSVTCDQDATCTVQLEEDKCNAVSNGLPNVASNITSTTHSSGGFDPDAQEHDLLAWLFDGV